MDRPSNSGFNPTHNSVKQKNRLVFSMICHYCHTVIVNVWFRLRASPFCPCFSPTITDSDSDDDSNPVGEVNKIGINWLWSPLEEVLQQRVAITGEATTHTGKAVVQGTSMYNFITYMVLILELLWKFYLVLYFLKYSVVNRLCETTVHRIVEYSYHLVPDIDRILAASFYWGVIDRFRAEELLEGKPEGTFLLRDSAQSEYLFSVSFRRYQRTLHARIEQANHRFGFDILDQSVFSAPTVIQLMENYKDPSRCLFFEPQLTYPLHRDKVFSLQQLCRGAIVSHTTYTGVSYLRLPSKLKQYIREYHYSIPVRTVTLSE
uniref:SH2 domain-containing protein n=1 Tax=Heterorhabditis bacteriophora TaxID=37862 RepID=A0A1I7XM17_HETBA